MINWTKINICNKNRNHFFRAASSLQETAYRLTHTHKQLEHKKPKKRHMQIHNRSVKLRRSHTQIPKKTHAREHQPTPSNQICIVTYNTHTKCPCPPHCTVYVHQRFDIVLHATFNSTTSISQMRTKQLRPSKHSLSQFRMLWMCAI